VGDLEGGLLKGIGFMRNKEYTISMIRQHNSTCRDSIKRATNFLFTTVLESKYMRCHITLNASVANILMGCRGADMMPVGVCGNSLEKVGYHLRMDHKGLEISSSRPV